MAVSSPEVTLRRFLAPSLPVFSYLGFFHRQMSSIFRNGDAFCGDTFPKIRNHSQQDLVLFVTAMDPLSALPDYTVRPKFTREIPPNGATSLDCRKFQDIEVRSVATTVVLWVFPKIVGDPKSNPGSYFEPAMRAKRYFISYRDLKEKKVIALDISKDGKVNVI